MADQKTAQLPASSTASNPPPGPEDRDRILDSFEVGVKDIQFTLEVRRLLTGFDDVITPLGSSTPVAREWCYSGLAGCNSLF